MKYIWLTLGILIVGISCSDSQKILDGDSFPYRENVGDIRNITTHVMQTESIPISVSTGYSPFLQLGAAEKYRAKILISFASIPDTFTVLESVLELKPIFIYGEGIQPFTVSVYDVISSWSEESVDAISVDLEPVSTRDIYPDTAGFDTFSLPKELVQRWSDSPETNHGLLLDFEVATFMKEYESSDLGTNRTFLRVRIRTPGNIEETYNMIPDNDIAILENSVEKIPSTVFIDKMAGYRIAMKFDVSSIPAEATINRAKLYLFMQTEESYNKRDMLDILRIFSIESWPWDSKNLSYNTSFSKSAYLETNEFDIIITPFVQQWVSNIIPNYGLVVLSTTEGENISRYAFYSSDIDSTRTPRLEIDYSLPIIGPLSEER